MNANPIPHVIARGGDGSEFVTAYAPEWDAPLVAPGDHPNFAAIVDALESGDPDAARDAFDASLAVARGFDRLSERVSVSHGRIFFDGDEVDDSVTRQILRFMDHGLEFRPLVHFMEKIAANPTDHSRAQLFDWLRALDFTLTPSGDVVAFKGVAESSETPGEFESLHAGAAYVQRAGESEAERIVGRIPNPIGAEVSMPRSDVAHDPGAACSTGLHVGTREYARSYARGALLEVHVNPRDVVSVPTDASGEKVRVSRYRVVGVSSAPYSAPLADDSDPCADF